MAFRKPYLMFSLFLTFCSCNEERLDTTTDFKTIEKVTQLKLGEEVLKLGEFTECFDIDCVTKKVYLIPAKKCVDFSNSINIRGDSLSIWGYWRREGNYLIYNPAPKKFEEVITMEYSCESHILIVSFYEN